MTTNPEDRINRCAVHWHADNPNASPPMDPDCDGCKAEQKSWEKEIDRLNQSAQDVTERLAQTGGPQMPPHIVNSIRMETLIDMMLGHDLRARLTFEAETGNRIVEQLKEAQRHTSQNSLSVPDKRLHVVRGGGKGH